MKIPMGNEIFVGYPRSGYGRSLPVIRQLSTSEQVFSRLEIDECESSPCVTGTCIDKENGFQCKCEPGFSGVFCEKRMCLLLKHAVIVKYKLVSNNAEHYIMVPDDHCVYTEIYESTICMLSYRLRDLPLISRPTSKTVQVGILCCLAIIIRKCRGTSIGRFKRKQIQSYKAHITTPMPLQGIRDFRDLVV